jgi:FkbM family methyltransferase
MKKSMLKGLGRKIRKAAYAMGDPISRAALRLGAAPSIEHLDVMRSLRPVSTVVDVGANIGQFALLARRVFPEATIHSFEPMPDAADRFQRSLKRAPHIHLHRTALGAIAGTSKIFVTRRQDSSSLLKPTLQTDFYPGGDVVAQIEIPVVALEDVLKPSDLASPALLKIDVQGFELEVLLGCRSRLRCFDWIYCELSFKELYEGQRLAPEVIAWLHREGFEMDGVYVGDLTYDADGRAVQADFLFRKVERVKPMRTDDPNSVTHDLEGNIRQ